MAPTTPCYVFRLVKFDENGNKVQKRKYGFTAKNNDVSQLDENVFNGIITRAEQTFDLRPSTYSIYLVLNSNSASSYINELGESDLHLEDYPALSSHSWSALHTFNQFEHKRELIAKLQPDKKGRKVVNLCLVQGTLHNVARVMKTKREAEEKVKAAKKASKGKGKAKEETEEEDAYKTPVLNTSSPADPSAENNTAAEDPKDVDISAEIAQCGAAQAEEKKKEQEDAPQDIAQEVADLVARFTNLVVPTTKPGQSQSQSRPRNGSNDESTTDTLRTSKPRNGPGYVTAYDHFGGSQYRPDAEGGESASFLPPLPPSHPPVTVNAKAHNGSFKDHKANNGNPFGNGMDFIKRAADFIAPPPPSSSFARPINSRPAAPVDLVASLAAAANTAARNASRYAETASTSPNIASAGLNKVKSAQDAAKAARDAAYAAREQAMLDAAIAASEREAEDKAMEEVQERLLKAITTNDNKSNKSKNTTRSASPTVMPTSPTSNDKLASLKQSFDKFVNDFNANLADAFGGLPPGYEMPSETTTTTTSSVAEPAVKREEEKVGNPSDQQEKKTTAEHGLNKFAHNATCDICDEWIVGTRYKCFSCPDWDCCSKCFASVDELHPGHSFAALESSTNLIRRKAPPSPTNTTPIALESATSLNIKHRGIHCDSCNKPIYGIRWKCITCPDFDLCAACEADPIPYIKERKIGQHPFDGGAEGHWLIKIRTPIGSTTGRQSFGSGVFGRNAATTAAQRAKLAEAIEKAKKTVHGSYYGAPPYNVHVPAATRHNSASQATQAEKTPEKKDERNLAEVSLPFAVPGGFKDINIDFKLKTNDKGEHVITNTEEISKALEKIVNGLVQDALAAKSPSENKSQARAVSNEENKEHANVNKELITPIAPQTQKSQTVDARLAYDARWMSDVTYNDGEFVFPGTVFNKVWSVENTGTKTWPEGTRLICVSGFGKDLASQHRGRKEVSYKVPTLLPGGRTNIIAEDIVAPEMPGKFMSYYRFVAPNGERFGDRLWIDIIVDDGAYLGKKEAEDGGSPAEEDNDNKINKSNSSLDSSRMVTPTIKVKGGSNNIETAESVTTTAPPSEAALMSPRTTESGLPDNETENMSVLSEPLSDNEEDCDFVLLSDDDDFDQV